MPYSGDHPPASHATQEVEHLNDSVPHSPAVDGTEPQQNEHLESDISRTSAYGEHVVLLFVGFCI